MPLPSEESTGDGSPDDIEFKERVDSRLIHEATEYLKRQSKHLCDGNILDQKISHVLSSISLQQTQNLSQIFFSIQELNKQELSSLSENLKLLNWARVEPLLITIMPVAKLGPSNYLIGTQKRKLGIIKGKLHVKTSGGQINLLKYMTNEAKNECTKLKFQIDSRGISL